MSPSDVLAELSPWRFRVDALLARYLDEHVDVSGERPPERLLLAMRHALVGSGKRLRPLIVLASARALEPSWSDEELFWAAGSSAIAVEVLHTYSLIHDDLPALDDDVLRRGKPTVHVAFDEATAVLAGDALLTDAFAILATAPHEAARQVAELANAAGSAGMVGGQMDDVATERSLLDVDVLMGIHRRKTGRLFSACAVLGGLSAQGSKASIELLRAYGAELGAAFQLADDLLDVVGDVEQGGKARGRDEKLDKVTTVRMLGPDEVRARAQAKSLAACDLARRLQAPLLERLARFCGERVY